MFAECIPSGTRRTSSLPSAVLKTLGKKNTRQIERFAECQNKNTRQRFCLPSVKKIHPSNKNKIFFLKKKKKKKLGKEVPVQLGERRQGVAACLSMSPWLHEFVACMACLG